LEMQADQPVDEDPRNRRLGLALGEPELRVLEIDQALAEGLALLDIGDRQIERALYDRDAGDADRQPLLRQLLHQLDKAHALLRTEQTTSCRKSPPPPPYSCGMLRHSNPASPASRHISRSTIPASSQLRHPGFRRMLVEKPGDGVFEDDDVFFFEEVGAVDVQRGHLFPPGRFEFPPAGPGRSEFDAVKPFWPSG